MNESTKTAAMRVGATATLAAAVAVRDTAVAAAIPAPGSEEAVWVFFLRKPSTLSVTSYKENRWTIFRNR